MSWGPLVFEVGYHPRKQIHVNNEGCFSEPGNLRAYIILGCKNVQYWEKRVCFWSCSQILEKTWWKNYEKSMQKPQGGTHIFGRTGMCRSNGSLFYKKSLNMGPVFYPKILKHGSTFLTEPQIMWFSGFSPCENPKNCEIFEK